MGRRLKGDTLVEVSLAIGIFSMVAITVVSVINGSANSAQSSLEATITREEMDGQAEALRFIQSAFIAGGEAVDSSGKSKYERLWDTLSARAIDLSKLSASDRDAVLKYNPVTCDEIYRSDNNAGWNTLKKQNAFIINTRAMSTNDINNIIVSYSPSIFKTATTYPRIIYGGNTSDALYNPSKVTGALKITGVEGLYVIGVRDKDGTVIVSDTDSSTTIKSAFIDFYIRSCWFTPGADRASTISTLVRLYDPSAVAINKSQLKGILIRYGGNGASTGSMAQQYVYAGSSTNILPNQFSWTGHIFKYWTTNANGTGTRYNPGQKYSVPANLSASSSMTLYAQWEVLQTNIKFNGNGATSGSMSTQKIAAGNTQRLNANAFSRTGYTFSRWTTNANGSGTRYDNRANYSVPSNITSEQTVNLYAQWTPNTYTISYNANGGSYAPASTSCKYAQRCDITTSQPSRSGYKFLGWSESSNASSPSYYGGNQITLYGSKTLYAVWQTQNETITVTLTWSRSPKDLDAHVQGQKSDGTTFHAYFGNKVGSDVSGLTIAQLDRDVTSGYGTETFIINTLGGRDYYYYVHNYTSSSSITNATVTVSGPYIGTHTYYAWDASGSGRYWNVFAYKDGRIVYKGTRSGSPDLSY